MRHTVSPNSPEQVKQIEPTTHVVDNKPSSVAAPQRIAACPARPGPRKEGDQAKPKMSRLTVSSTAACSSYAISHVPLCRASVHRRLVHEVLHQPARCPAPAPTSQYQPSPEPDTSACNVVFALMQNVSSWTLQPHLHQVQTRTSMTWNHHRCWGI